MKYCFLVLLVALSLLLPSRVIAAPLLPSYSQVDTPLYAQAFAPQYPLMAGLSNLHHPVSTSNPTAQQYFDQGLKLVYAFNHEEAIRSFQQALELDPQLAMAHWGIALSLGPNINLDVDPERELAAYQAIQQAIAIANTTQITDREKDYIAALAKRYSDQPHANLKQLAHTYKEAMAAIAKRYPDDLDAATLYAESLMDLNPWQLWSPSGEPTPDTLEILAVLESVLQRNPDHIGANHYYIHAVEASPQPERAFASAKRLETLAPAAGHLVHMPSHIYFRMGDYVGALEANRRAIAADEAYIHKYQAQGVYPLIYYSHNLDFLSVAASMVGRYTEAKQAAEQLVAAAMPSVAMLPMAEGYLGSSLLVQVYFRDWKTILQTPKPDPKFSTTTALWHFARGMSYAALGKQEEARQARRELLAQRRSLPAEATIRLAPADLILEIATHQLDAQIARMQQDYATAVRALRQAAAAEEKLTYIEPPDWFLPSRETLGAVLLEQKEFAAAERAFRDDLAKFPHNGRSLYGLQRSLEGQGKEREAKLARAEFKSVWKYADTKLQVAML